MAVHIQEIGTARAAGKSAVKVGGGFMGTSSRRELDFSATLAEQSRRTSKPPERSAKESIKESTERPEKAKNGGEPAHSADEANDPKSDTAPTSSTQAKKTNKGSKSKSPDSDDAVESEPVKDSDSTAQADETTEPAEEAAADTEVAEDLSKSKTTKENGPDPAGDANSSENAASEAMLAAAAATAPAKNPKADANPGASPDAAKTPSKGQPLAAKTTTSAGQAKPQTTGKTAEQNGADVAALNALAGMDDADSAQATAPAASADKKGDKKTAPPGQPAVAGLVNVPALGAPAAGAAMAATQQGAKTSGKSGQPASDAQGSSQAVESLDASLAALAPEGSASHKAAPGDDSASDGSASAMRDLLVPLPGDKTPAAPPAPSSTPAPAPPRPEIRFAEANHPSIVQGITGQVLAKGGTMHLRLDPPELGAMQVTVNVKDGLMTASFQTSNDEATRLLSHSLHDLKSLLESQGVQVQKLQVQQQSSHDFDSNSNNGGDTSRQQQQAMQDNSARQEQQRKEMIRRMWAKLGVGNDPLDVTG
jgi:flagellar hook-length control protein FliK